MAWYSGCSCFHLCCSPTFTGGDQLRFQPPGLNSPLEGYACPTWTSSGNLTDAATPVDGRRKASVLCCELERDTELGDENASMYSGTARRRRFMPTASVRLHGCGWTTAASLARSFEQLGDANGHAGVATVPCAGMEP